MARILQGKVTAQVAEIHRGIREKHRVYTRFLRQQRVTDDFRRNSFEFPETICGENLGENLRGRAPWALLEV
jgi:hypothetical protein